MLRLSQLEKAEHEPTTFAAILIQQPNALAPALEPGATIAGTPAYRHCRSIAMLAAIVLFAGCATTYPLMPTPTVYVGQQAKPIFSDIPADSQESVGRSAVRH